MAANDRVVVMHGLCPHDGSSWNQALAQALSHANLTATVPERNSIVESLRKGEPVFHQGIPFAAIRNP